jgi:hypothetical protein
MVGAVLYQVHPDGKERTVAYLSHLLTRIEQAYSNTEREAFAIIYAVKKWKQMLTLMHFTVHTDHVALLYLYGRSSRTSPQSNRLAKWQVELSGYDFTLAARPGRNNVRADALSRSVPEKLSSAGLGQGPVLGEDVIKLLSTLLETRDSNINAVFAGLAPSETHAKFAEKQRQDPELAPLVTYLENGTLPADSEAAKTLLLTADQYTLTDDVLYLLPKKNPRNHDNKSFVDTRMRIVVPNALKADMLREMHDNPLDGAHLGAERVYEKLTQRFWWRGMFADTTF